MNITALNTFYNHYLTTYAPNGINSQYDTHKKSELRGVYNSIVKLNKEAPLAILDTSRASQAFAVGIKESARALHNTIASVSGRDAESLLEKKTAFSTNEDIATATFIGDAKDVDDAPAFSIEVRRLAAEQVNTGNYLPDGEIALTPDTYSFDVGINSLNYEFQFLINEGDTNRSVQERLARLINNAEIGLSAEVLEDDEGNSALKLSSKATGLPDGRDDIFHVSDTNTSKLSGAVDYLGIGEITRPAANAEFLINGSERTASSNHFTVEQVYSVNLTGLSPSEGDTAEIGVKPDHESLKENITKLIGGYNDFIRATAAYLDSQPKSARLMNEMAGIASVYANDLDTLGIYSEENGELSIDDERLSYAVEHADNEEVTEPLKDFTQALMRKSSGVSLNPMNYVNKIIVAYKNPGHGYASPYVTSAYSGMMFNSYC
ncbi:MAG: flagellar filament capping protein FliD [Lachnospiraceae bacterium]|nr:flagellar filament capping protein FliD [Lachnospiraceae bacterium]MBD5482580.1 flagellar filament capping protein FliD [Lachnospiraceae bacterium]